GKSERTTVGHGYVLAKEASDAINDLSYRPGGSNNAAVLAKISPEQNNHGETTLTSADLRGSTEFGELAGGAIGLAVGVEARRESIKIDPDSHLKRAEWVGLGSSSADGSRNVQSMFGELRLPVLKTLEAEAAVRFDHYSDYGNSTTPKVGLKWTPNSTIALRSTYSEGFRAPGLTQISKSSVQSFNTITDRLRCAGNVDPKTLDGTECTSGRSISSQIQANPNLNPERSKSYTLGLVFSPTNNFSSTVDYYEIRRRDEIDRVGSQYIIDQTYLNGDQRFVNQIFRNPLQDTWVRDKSGNLIPNSGPIVSTVRKFFNLGESRLKGVDLSVTLKNSLGEYGKLSSTFDGSYMLSYKQYTFPGDPFRDYAGASGPNGALPRLKASMASTWSKGPYNVTGRVNFTDGWYNSDSFLNCATTTNPAYTAEFPNCRVSSWTTFDLNVGYTGIKNLTLSATVRNLFNREAPYDDSSTAIINQGYNDGFHNPYGRYLNVSASYKFY
ncbi:TonB-dependent receptor domain-containing protein, partial [Chitinimonas sp.]|uniref:TonB-dependent receptor domain-containing protein n=1 Tax=Chitinimonas sp. TaxID=1934313 RepID=UPI0035AE0BA3